MNESVQVCTDLGCTAVGLVYGGRFSLSVKYSFSAQCNGCMKKIKVKMEENKSRINV